MASPTDFPKASDVTAAQCRSTLALYQFLENNLFEEDMQKRLKSGHEFDVTKFHRLERNRYERMPQADRTYMSKQELQDAMQWKLQHGTFRPQLNQLVAQNDSDVVQETTEAAFGLYKADPSNYTAPLKRLAELKGVGPATASLLLSIYDEDNAPFFSDELFRWICWDPNQGWKQKIKYDLKEYGLLWKGVKTLRERLGGVIKAVELEKVAYVCGRLGVNAKLAAAIRSKAERVEEPAKAPVEASHNIDSDEDSDNPDKPRVVDKAQRKAQRDAKASEKLLEEADAEAVHEGGKASKEVSHGSRKGANDWEVVSEEQNRKTAAKLPTKSRAVGRKASSSKDSPTIPPLTGPSAGEHGRVLRPRKPKT